MRSSTVATTTTRRRRVRAAVAMTSIIAATVAGAIATTSAQAASSSTSTSASAATRAQIPWSKVGSGWMVASLANGKANTLYLLDSAGHRYADANLPKDASVTDWSPDGQRVLLGTTKGAVELNLRTGKTHAISIKAPKGGDVEILGYTKPRGLALLVDVFRPYGDYQLGQLERFGLDSKHQQDYPVSVPGAGQLNGYSATETANGAELIVPAMNGMVLLQNNGKVVRRLTPKSECFPVRMWNTANVLATCSDGALYTVPLSGAAPHRITTGRDNKTVYIGFIDEWNYSHGTLGLSANGCGPASLVKISNGHAAQVTIPSPSKVAGRAAFYGHYKSLVEGTYTEHNSCNGGRTAVFAYNAVTKHSTSLLGPGATAGSVTGLVVFRADKIGSTTSLG